MAYNKIEIMERDRSRKRLSYVPKERLLTPQPIQLESQKRALLQQILYDWDKTKLPLYKHLQQWQDWEDSYKYELMTSALGQYRTNLGNIPNRTLRRWMNQLAICHKS